MPLVSKALTFLVDALEHVLFFHLGVIIPVTNLLQRGGSTTNQAMVDYRRLFARKNDGGGKDSEIANESKK